MRLLFTNHHLADLGGTELFTREVALEWQRRGHQVAVLTTKAGAVANELRESGVFVTTAASALPFEPQLIHGQHHIPTMMALVAFPKTRALFYCHGYAPWQEQPPAHPRLLKYVGMAEHMREWLQTKLSLDESQIEILPTAVDTVRFDRIRNPSEKPGRALIFGNHITPADHAVHVVQQACSELGIELECIGSQFHNVRAHPHAWLPDYDWVFAAGRSALEALACGCAVIPIAPKQCGHFITPETFQPAQRYNFTVPSKYPSATAEEVIAQIQKYDPGSIASVTAHVREQLSFAGFCDKLEALHQSLLHVPFEPSGGALEQEVLSDYLLSLAVQIDAMETDHTANRFRLFALKEKQQELKEKLDSARQKIKLMDQRPPPNCISKLWRRLKRQ